AGMTNRLLSAIVVAMTVLLIGVAYAPLPGNHAGTSRANLRTPWGEPDLQGIWQDPTQTPLQRPAQYANREFLTDAEIAAIDAKREALDRREHRAERGTEQDVAGAYNAVFESHRKTGRRTSLVVDPPNGRADLASNVRPWYGDARGHWEGDTLVVETTNFGPRTFYRGAHDNLHLVERFRRADAETIEYSVRVEDPTTWVQPWTIKTDLKKNPDQYNRIFESTCHEGNYGLTGMLANTRAAERAFAAGK